MDPSRFSIPVEAQGQGELHQQEPTIQPAIEGIFLEIAGQPILAGEGLILAETFANRDGAVFPDPDGFDVFRSNSRVHLGFGHGGHHCLGAHLARMELTLGLSTLFRRVPGLRLVCSFEDLVFQDGLTIYGVESLPVAWPAG